MNPKIKKLILLIVAVIISMSAGGYIFYRGKKMKRNIESKVVERGDGVQIIWTDKKPGRQYCIVWSDSENIEIDDEDSFSGKRILSNIFAKKTHKFSFKTKNTYIYYKIYRNGKDTGERFHKRNSSGKLSKENLNILLLSNKNSESDEKCYEMDILKDADYYIFEYFYPDGTILKEEVFVKGKKNSIFKIKTDKECFIFINYKKTTTVGEKIILEQIEKT